MTDAEVKAAMNAYADAIEGRAYREPMRLALEAAYAVRDGLSSTKHDAEKEINVSPVPYAYQAMDGKNWRLVRGGDASSISASTRGGDHIIDGQ